MCSTVDSVKGTTLPHPLGGRWVARIGPRRQDGCCSFHDGKDRDQRGEILVQNARSSTMLHEQ